jgi:glycosyltransferase involved in cell wall biosynthesis
MTPKVLIIIPAYNEEKNIEKVVRNIEENFSQYDYIVVNDGSTDSTKDVLERNHFHYLDLPQNLGIGGGVQTGYKYADANGYDIAIQIDGDGQHDPAFIAQLIQPILDGQADMVIGSRFLEKEGFQTSSMRRLGIRYFKHLLHALCGVTITDATSGFRASSAALTRYFTKDYAEDYPEPEAILSSVLNGFRVMEIPVVMHERQGGESSINALKSVYYMIKVTLAIIISRIRFWRKREKPCF